MSKKRIIVDYKTLPNHILEKIAQDYPDGLNQHTIKYTNSRGDKVSAIPVETEEAYYLVKVSVQLRQMVDEVDLEEIDASYDDDFSYEEENGDYDDD